MIVDCHGVEEELSMVETSPMGALKQQPPMSLSSQSVASDDLSSPSLPTVISAGSTSSNESSSAVTEVKPFFIMDWLESIKPEDLELAQRMLKTPQKKEGSASPDTSGLTSPKTLFAPKNNKKPTEEGSFRRRSIAIGNGWNAKGLHKAKNGAWQEASSCWLNALEIREQVLGDSHLDVANTLNNLGIAYGKLGRIAEAQQALERALAIRTQHFGRQHTEVAATLHNMGNVLQQGGDLEGAIECFHETKVLHEQLLGPKNVQVARSCIAMGHTYYQAHAYRDAREAYLDAILIFESAGLGTNNIEVQNALADIQELDRCIRKLNH